MSSHSTPRRHRRHTLPEDAKKVLKRCRTHLERKTAHRERDEVLGAIRKDLLRWPWTTVKLAGLLGVSRQWIYAIMNPGSSQGLSLEKARDIHRRFLGLPHE